MTSMTIRVAIQLAQEVYKRRKTILIILFCALMSLVMLVLAFFGSAETEDDLPEINDIVLSYYPVVASYAIEHEIEDYINIILAIIMIETGGEEPDIMQSSQSLGLPANSITDPIASIEAGVKHLAEVIKDAEEKGLDFWTPIQSYNFGGGFNNYVSDNGKYYSFELAESFSADKADNVTVTYNNPVAEFNGSFRYDYGNMYYVLLVQSYIGETSQIGNANASALGSGTYETLMNEATKYNGWPYRWGGANPQTSFDCSGLLQYIFKKIGYHLPRTAAEQYKATIRIPDPQPGDLVFFKGTNSSRSKDAITHVGIYIDENRMFDASSSGIGYHNWSSGYWAKHFAGFGRVTNVSNTN